MSSIFVDIVREVDFAFVRKLAVDDLPAVSQETHRIIDSIANDISISGKRVFIEAAVTLAATRAFIKSKHEKVTSTQDVEVKPQNMIKPPAKDGSLKPLEVLVESFKFGKAKVVNRLVTRKESVAPVRGETSYNRTLLAKERQQVKQGREKLKSGNEAKKGWRQSFATSQGLESWINRQSVVVRKDRRWLMKKQSERLPPTFLCLISGL